MGVENATHRSLQRREEALSGAHFWGLKLLRYCATVPPSTQSMETPAWTELKLQKLRRQVTAFWLTDRHSPDFGDVAHALAATDAQVDSKLAEVGRAEGTMPSRVVPGLFISRGGALLSST